MGIDLAHTRLGPAHPATLNLRNNYTKSLLDSGFIVEAEQEAREIIQEMEAIDPSASQNRSLIALSYLSSSLSKQNRNEEALALVSEVLAEAKKTHHPSSIELARFIGVYCSALKQAQRFGEAEITLTEAWNSLEGTDSTGNDAKAYIRDLMTELYTAWNTQDPDEDRKTKVNMWRNK